MDLSDLQRNWDEFGRADPFWAILTVGGAENNRWDLQQFFASGRDEIGALMAYLDRVAPGLPRREALDFGCGVGRLTQPLGQLFERAVGVDIAASMIDRARQFDATGRCEFVLLGTGDLRAFPDGEFDLIYSNITLQHMHPRYSTAYIREFVRVLRAGGVGVFQLPSRPISIRSKAMSALRVPYRLVRRATGGRPVMEMYTVSAEQVRRLLDEAGADLVDLQPDASPGPHFESYRYCIRKR